MTEGYKRGCYSMDDFVAESEKLHNVARDDLLRDIEYSMGFRNGKATGRGKEVAIAHLATQVLAHLELAGYVFKRKPPRPAHSTHEGPRLKD